MKKMYLPPSLVVIGQITALTGMVKNLNYLDNTNGSDAWCTRAHSNANYCA